jgi:hypothetical protein
MSPAPHAAGCAHRSCSSADPRTRAIFPRAGGVAAIEEASWTDDQARCVRACDTENGAATHLIGTVGLMVGALVAALYALPLFV